MRRRRVLLFGLVLPVLGAGIALRAHRAPAGEWFEVRPSPLVRRVSGDGVLEAAKATPVLVPNEAQGALQIAWIVDDGFPVAAGEVVARLDATESKKELERGETTQRSVNEKLAKLESAQKASSRQLGRDVELAGRELQLAEEFRVEDAELQSRQQIAEAMVDETLAKEKMAHAENVRGTEDKLAQADRGLLELEGKLASIQVDRAKKILAAVEIRAPHAGLLLLERNWRGEVPRVGDAVWGGRKLGEIPQLEVMKAKLFVLEADAGGLVAGRPVELRLESQPERVIRGQVETVEPVAKPRHRGSPVQYFEVAVTVERTDPETMKPGARVLASIEIENRSDALLVPRQAIFERKGKSVVYKQTDGQALPVAVTLGAGTAGRVAIASGLAAGDRIALFDVEAEANR